MQEVYSMRGIFRKVKDQKKWSKYIFASVFLRAFRTYSTYLLWEYFTTLYKYTDRKPTIKYDLNNLQL